MLRKTTYAMMIAILTIGAASAQTDAPPHIQGISGYSPMRTQQERIHDRDIDRAYESAVKSTSKGPDAKKNSSDDPWGDVRQPPAAAKNKEQR
jgi:hypothetical protein